MGFFQTYWTWQNAQLSGYIGDNTARVAAAIEPALIAMAVVYVMLWGYLHLTGRIEEPVSNGLTRIVRLVVVLGVGLHLWLYNDVIVDTFYRAPAQLANAIIGTSDPIDTVDAIWTRGGTVAENVKHLGSGFFSGLGFELESLIVWFLTAVLCVYVMFLISLSSIASSVLLAVGPLFVAFYLFDGTRRLFEAWVVQLVNYALVTILTVLVAALLLHLVESYATQTAARGSATTDVDALDMLLVMGLVSLLLRQIMPIAAGLAGGVGLSSLGALSGAVRWARYSHKQAVKAGLGDGHRSLERQVDAQRIAEAMAESFRKHAAQGVHVETSPSWHDGQRS
jgi:type IV secretion system protein VirB6